ncbi:MAG: hypothetical protein SF182_22740 [Deltaproteobacteria bacterium]|nr:hypothetical protein [Deltaproteobacteria bacterium]
MTPAPAPDGRIDVVLSTLPATLASAHPEFMAYAAAHLAPLRVAGGQAPVVEASLAWHEDIPPLDRLAAYPELADMERVDRDVYRNATRIAWFRIDELPSLFLRFAWDGRRLRVHGDFFVYLSQNPYQNWLKRGLRRRHLARLRQRRFTTLLYYLLYYPCFWVLERTRDLHPIHAAGVEMQGNVVVLAGPSGVGKSTLVTGLAGASNARLLSDTFLLHRGATMCAVPEPLLLDTWSQRWLGEAAVHLRSIPHRYCLSRNGFHWPAERNSGGGVARLLLFPQRSSSHYLRPLSPATARGRLSASNLIVNDLRRYWAFSSVLELIDPTSLVLAREESLATLSDAVPAYELGLSPRDTRAAVAEDLDAILPAPAFA